MRPALILAGCAVLAGLPASALAQAGAGIATAEDCARRPSPQEELACLRAALTAREKLARDAAGQEQASQEQPFTPLPQPAAPAPPPRLAPARDLGAEQLAESRAARGADHGAERPLTASIVAFNADHLGRVTMRLDNGQVWQQAEPSGLPLRLKETGQRVEITRSGFGGYRMRLPEMGRRLAVRRVE